MFTALLDICFLLSLSIHLGFTKSFTPMHPICHEEERSTLLQFKHSFSINKSASIQDPSAYPKTATWNESKRGDGGDGCHCSWEGVECEPSSGRVISLDLSSSCLYGSINSTSSLFRLIHLRRLNLAYNDFNHSQIPSQVGLLSRLTHLNLSYSSFSGQIPEEVLQLSQLVVLELRGNPGTRLLNPGFRSLVQNMAALQVLHLSGVNISSAVPHILANISSLSSLFLTDCGLHGEFPSEIFHLPNLRSLSLSINPNLTGVLPEFPKGSPLQHLRLVETSFYGKLPSSIGNLDSLNSLAISNSNISGSFPPSMANLKQLSLLAMSDNNFASQALPSWLGKLSQLTDLELNKANLKGEVSSSLANLTQLLYLSLRSNQLMGQIPNWFTNITRLTVLDVSQNELQGSLPDSVFQCRTLQRLYFNHNNLSGMVNLDKFVKLPNLTHLDLSDNRFSVFSNTNISISTSQKWKAVGLASCNLSKFPDFLRAQNELQWLVLRGNNLHGLIPQWVWNISTENLVFLDLRYNFLTGFEQHPVFLPWKRLHLLTMIGNRLQGFLPVPPPSIYVYEVANNSFIGNLPEELCSLTLLYVLDMSNNNFSGAIPPCFGNFSNNLVRLNLKGNNFHGIIPQTLSGSKLRSIDLSENQLRGQLPRSLVNCTGLEILDIGNNQIKDKFPYWLGILPNLKIIILRSNRFHGIVGGMGNDKDFPELRIVDLSQNGFFGNLPAEYFHNWNSMKEANRKNSSYMTISFTSQPLDLECAMVYSTELITKGVELPYLAVRDTLMFIDLSSNKFSGAIPKSIVDLKGLHSLNLSNNNFGGSIPSSLGNLVELESLDLSHNRFSGEIPVELAQLTFLAVFNASYNNLSGDIPHGEQFDTFSNTSYLGNSRLCGNPLSKQCGDSETNWEEDTETDTESGTEWNWVVASMGYASGLVIGAVIGCALTARKHEWFVETFGRRQARHKKRR